MTIEQQPPPLSLQPTAHSLTQAGPHENEWYRQDFGSYRVREVPLHQKRPMRLIIVGAGAAGLEIAYKVQRQMENISFEIFEKNTDIGGTWLENRYPGCTCDIPSHSYQWSFWRNPNWSSYYSGSQEIWQYLKDFATQNDLERHVKFSHRVQKANWIEEESVWEVKVQTPTGEIITSTAEILVSCHGGLK